MLNKMSVKDIIIKHKHILFNGLICIDIGKIEDDKYDQNKVVCINCLMQALNAYNEHQRTDHTNIARDMT